MKTKAAMLTDQRALGDHGARPRRPEGQRGPDPVRGGRAVPLRRAPASPATCRRRCPSSAATRAPAIIEADRPGRHRVAPGDHVVCCVHPVLRHVPVVLDRAARTCATWARRSSTGCMPDGTLRFHARTARTSARCACSARSPQYAVVNEASCVKVDEDLPFEVAALVGCGVPTGCGSAVNAADVAARRHRRGLRHRRHRHQRRAGRRAWPAPSTSSPSTRWSSSARRRMEFGATHAVRQRPRRPSEIGRRPDPGQRAPTRSIVTVGVVDERGGRSRR